MNSVKSKLGLAVVLSVLLLTGCVPKIAQRPENTTVPSNFTGSSATDTLNSATMKWNEFFTDPYLVSLIDTALKNNQELNITLQEIIVTQSEIRSRKGDYLPFVGITAGGGVDKPSRYTSKGASDYSSVYEPGEHLPEPLGDVKLGIFASWEIDIWKKLRNAKKSATYRYLSSIEGRNFMVTKLIGEIASSYYELMALDNHLQILETTIGIQQDALQIVQLQKDAARVTELAVRRFQAEVLKNQSLQFEIRQKIVETENRINFLVGRFPQPVQRNSANFISLVPNVIYAGVPTQLLANRPDIKQAELDLAAAKLDVLVARADFYPTLRIDGGIGIQGFNLAKLVRAPESILYGIAAELVVPLVNRNAIKAKYYSSGAKQTQAVFSYEMAILKAYIEVANQVSKIANLQQTYTLKSQQVDALNQSITISVNLFRSARADYMEVLLTQRDALEARMDLVDIKMEQMNALVKLYQELGGGWR